MDRKRKLGQVFLRNMTIVDEIIRIACPTCEDIFIEIGAGFGVLTEPLSKRVRKVYAIELDNTLVGILKERFWSRENVEIINENILKLSFLDIAKSHERKLRIIGNIPYSISSPILFKLLEHRTLFHSFLLMFQKEVADRIVARSSTKSYGLLSIFSQIYAEVEKVLDVRKECFHPKPKVDSAVVRFSILDSSLIQDRDEKVFKQVVRASFSHRRKTLKNSLLKSPLFSQYQENLIEKLTDIGIDVRRRGETLSIKEFEKIAQILNKLGFS